MDIVCFAKNIIKMEANYLHAVGKALDGTIALFLDYILNCRGKVICIGMGKSGLIARKIAASMSSLGTCTISLHPADCLHGDLGMIQPQDVVMLISHSGESNEMIELLPSLRVIGARLLGITFNGASTLAKACDVVQVFDEIQEACYLGLAPTTSTTIVMAYGDALAITAAKMKRFTKTDYSIFHPSGALGKKLTIRAIDLMNNISNQHYLHEDSTIREALGTLIGNRVDLLTVVNQKDQLIGVVTKDELLCSLIDRTIDADRNKVGALVHSCLYVDVSAMAVDALRIMESEGVNFLPVVRDEKPIGIIEKSEILRVGICC